ncbi:MAG: hypothetical protein D6725_17775 [Planctomycetota bacterium]|nr:MAG: hypothetical protein D6725_17775 [Planctomycetota bacterium]
MQGRILSALAMGIVVGGWWAGPVLAAGIEAVPGKEYRLTKRHGPWMIMVCTLYEPPKEVRKEGISYLEAAQRLVYELRKRGIPAYTFRQGDVVKKIETVDRLGRPQERIVREQRRSISVIAGNYPSVDDPVAQKTLAYIKSYRPRSWADDARYRSTPGRPGPLSGAFLTINPLLTPDEVAERARDPLLVRLNADEPFSILNAKGRYSLVVASFYGKTITTLPDGRATGDLDRFEKTLGQTLDEAARRARALVRLLRTGRYRSTDTFGDVGQPDFVGRPIEAYVFHDRYQSVVTVGSFDSPNDPRIRELYEKFRAKVRKHAQTGQDVLTAEFVRSLGDPRRKIPPETFLFDPQPQLMKVPRL